ncbi:MULTISPECIES: hypothetical protein [Sorangium]|uniref:Uncharacterized protein n=1 Tax=Sorangium cellulosum TaxID=56 RepID=A0A4P2QHR4_SORCE|nr:MULTISPECIES: hypothetical protein [Sorangium]AUX29430.1 uncharacterized protein SOCE836_015200 [Sorangium cellulosum]WCQ88825.1 hypothetical protein NQZ70_01507 [Sorangium sp. Soce836]
MPTIEFFGYSDDDRAILEHRVRERLDAEPFRGDCVFVTAARSRVRDWQGNERPFLRVSTRSVERAERFKVLLNDLCDLEIVQIGFNPMSIGEERDETNHGYGEQ